MQNKLFKKNSLERFSSPEKLNDFIQVANPASRMALCAVLALMLGVLIWGFFGELTEKESFNGLGGESTIRCYVRESVAFMLEEGMEVSIVPLEGDEEAGEIAGRVVSIADRPLSYVEASEGIESDYLLDMLGIFNWNIVVEVETDEPLYEDVVYRVSAVTNTMRPVDLLFE